MLVLLALLIATMTATTCAAILYCRYRLNWPCAAALRIAIADVLGWLGLFAAFYALDTLTMVLMIRLAREATGSFISYYLANDLSIPVMATLQAAIFRFWDLRRAANRPPVRHPDRAPAAPGRLSWPDPH